MSTRAIIAEPTVEGFVGRYLCRDGYPGHTGAALYRRLRREGFAAVCKELQSTNAHISDVEQNGTLTPNEDGVLEIWGAKGGSIYANEELPDVWAGERAMPGYVVAFVYILDAHTETLTIQRNDPDTGLEGPSLDMYPCRQGLDFVNWSQVELDLGWGLEAERLQADVLDGIRDILDR